jgi:hypothetical protein
MGAAALRDVLEVAVGSVERSERGNALRTWKPPSQASARLYHLGWTIPFGLAATQARRSRAASTFFTAQPRVFC